MYLGSSLVAMWITIAIDTMNAMYISFSFNCCHTIGAVYGYEVLDSCNVSMVPKLSSRHHEGRVGICVRNAIGKPKLCCKVSHLLLLSLCWYISDIIWELCVCLRSEGVYRFCIH